MMNKISEEWFPIKRELEDILVEAKETKHITYAKREVENRGYGGAIMGKAGHITFKSEQELIKYLNDIIMRLNIDFEGYNFVYNE